MKSNLWANPMVDIPLTESPPTNFSALKLTRWLLMMVLVLIASVCLAVAASEATEKDKCKTTLGRLAVQFKLDSHYSNCRCMTHSLNFSDSCNSMYLPVR
jgi:hypothetical protein